MLDEIPDDLELVVAENFPKSVERISLGISEVDEGVSLENISNIEEACVGRIADCGVDEDSSDTDEDSSSIAEDIDVVEVARGLVLVCKVELESGGIEINSDLKKPSAISEYFASLDDCPIVEESTVDGVTEELLIIELC